jgi:hypothetical protein
VTAQKQNDRPDDGELVSVRRRGRQPLPARQPMSDPDPIYKIARPQSRGECKGGPRPCPWVGCRYHLLLDVGEKATGRPKALRVLGARHHILSLLATAPAVVVDAIADEAVERLAGLSESCALDIADRGGIGPKQIARALGLSRQAVQKETGDLLADENVRELLEDFR